ncbi:uncharacterized protein EDB91DRAFT_334598 [Suillus paluster]|uniref:uncharacterized protein n=1 Tax=Suillus paluster TaxID=48578 RepID=UPI001B879265|nr:uncharacterized protein EDB91DRAFT_334598 [Suillus paluster]KAG1741555.1 hypothetical protein EDB91DRAFT_334598 [Suillus paluster]
MLEDETEVLDWGNEEEDRSFGEQDPSLAAEDAEDAVSLGGDEDDEFLTYQSRVSQDTTTQRTQSPSKTVHHPEKHQEIAATGADARAKAPEHDRPKTPARLQETQTVPEPSPALNRQLSFGKLTHALPPKPIVSSVPFMHPSHPSIIEATAMAARVDRDKKNGIVSKPATFESGDALPPDWEVRHPRNGRGVYYYNSRTKESTWTRPGSSTSARDRRVPDDTRDIAIISKPDDSLTSRIGRSEAVTILSYDDRHYRPGESTRRDERPPMQSYDSQNDSFLASNRANGERSLSSPPRHRADDRVPSSRRLRSPSANGEQNRGRPSTKDTARPDSPIADADRVWVAPRVPSPVDRPALHEGKHREAEQPPHKERERRESPRDADRMSTTIPYFVLSYSTSSSHGHTVAHHGSLSSSSFSPYPYIYPPLFSFPICYSLGLRSPISHNRDTQYPPILPSSNDSDIARTGLSSAARQKSRFAQAPSAQTDQRPLDLPDKPSRPQARSLSTDGTRSRYRTSDRHKADARAHESPDMTPQPLPQASQEQLVPPPPSPPIERTYSSPIRSSFLMPTSSAIRVHLSLVQALENGCLCHRNVTVFRRVRVAKRTLNTARHHLPLVTVVRLLGWSSTMHAFLQVRACLLWRRQENTDPPTLVEALGKRLPVLRLTRTLR